MRGLILSAGFGTRLKPHTDQLAKPAVPFLNLPIMAYPLFYLERAGLTDLAINTHYLPKTIENAIESLKSGQYSITYYHESPEILGSGGGLYNAKKTLCGDGHFVVLNGDNVTLFERDNPLEELIKAHVEQENLATLLVCPDPEAGRSKGGVFVNSKTLDVKRFGKIDENSNWGVFHYASAMVLSDEIFDFLSSEPSNILYEGLTQAIQQGRQVKVHVDNSITPLETGNEVDYLNATRHSLLEVNAETNKGLFLANLISRFKPGWNNHHRDGIITYTPPKQHIQTDDRSVVLIGDDVEIDSGISVTDFAVFGDGCKIGKQCSISGSVVLSNLRLPANTSFKNQLISKTF